MNRMNRKWMVTLVAAAMAVAAGGSLARMERGGGPGACQQGDGAASGVAGYGRHGGRAAMMGGRHGQRGGGLALADSDGDGQVTLEEFTAHASERAAARFLLLDQDGDGQVSSDEHGQAVAGGRHGGAWSGDIDRVALHQCMEEQLDLVLPPPTDPRARFTAADSDGDGSLSSEEFAAAAATRAGERFAIHDSDGDGVVSLDEWSGEMAGRRAARAACMSKVLTGDESAE